MTAVQFDQVYGKGPSLDSTNNRVRAFSPKVELIKNIKKPESTLQPVRVFSPKVELIKDIPIQKHDQTL